ncbi:MAG: DNA repair protein RecN [Hyphomicrobiales bacterium]|nr:DNA repair protein RecN [Hyphomicrobiales bacterium]
MLVQLAIRDIVLIDRLDLEVGPGLTVLTGETGAGKSILLDAFSLALGARGDGNLVRAGQSQGQVTAVFDLAMDHPARLIARAQEIDDEGDLILRRVQMADGRTRAFVNDQAVSAQALRAIGRALVEIHGQHDDRALVDPATHRDLVDAFGSLAPDVEGVRAAYRALRAAQESLALEEARVAQARAEADYLNHAHAELSKLAPEAGEEERLSARRQAMMQSEKVASDLSEAHDMIGGEGSPIAALSSALRKLDRRQPQAPGLIDPCLGALGAALDALEQARHALEHAVDAANFDPRELERVEERLFALRAAARKYQTPVESLPALAEQFAQGIAALAAGESGLKKLAEDEKRARADFDKRAALLSKARAAAAKRLDKAVMAELAPLKLDRAEFTTRVESDGAHTGADGVDRIEFWVQTNPGSRPGPLMKVASGGELARFMLALKVTLADKGSAPTLVFDEIDTGVGGAVADAIGQRLARLSSRVQALAVTHAPQVAARAAQHLRIAKANADKGKRVATGVEVLPPEARREEIARMLSGATITAEARAAAARLMADEDTAPQTAAAKPKKRS